MKEVELGSQGALLHRIGFAWLRLRQNLARGRIREVRLDDQFGRALTETIRSYYPKKMLEIGSWDGTGSTACLLRRMHYTPEFLDCVELQPDKAAVIKKLIVPRFPFVNVHICSSISYDEWSF